MESRQEQLLQIIIDLYIDTAQPVGSKAISEGKLFNLSSATIRNEMAELEDAGFVFQPHTSAGRIPTEDGYQYYVENLIKITKVDKKLQARLKEIIEEEKSLRELAKGLAVSSQLAVYLGYDNKDYFYTGLSNLFGQPEFIAHELVNNISEAVDNLDEIIYNMFDEVSDKPQIFIGSRNPFGNYCSTILAKFKSKNKKGILGILGPQRMDYNKNLALIKYSQEIIKGL
ncbi:hypothetical protein KKA15_00075 [Patescibacteria group bacterium]|nr:hypothetical protein [Patescibacteria group bacterium]